MTNENLSEIQKQIEYSFNNVMLLQQAFIRRSFSQEHQDHQDNEVLEFIGDKVLDYIIVKELTEYFLRKTENGEYSSKHPESELTEIKIKLVEKKMLAHRIDILGFNKYLIMGNGDAKNNIQDDVSVKEDLFEAIIGAVTLDSGWNADKLESVIDRMLAVEHYIENGFDDDDNYVDLIQQWCQKENNGLPEYSYTSMYNKAYRCTVYLKGISNSFTGEGNSKSQARMNAAKSAYMYLSDNNLLIRIQDEIDEPSLDMSVNQLNILSQKGYFSSPEYNFGQSFDADGNPVWTCECIVKEYRDSFTNSRSSKKDAKKASAYEMLLYVLNLSDSDYVDDDEEYDDSYDD